MKNPTALLPLTILGLGLSLSLAAQAATPAGEEAHIVPITSATAGTDTVLVQYQSIGRLASKNAPTLSAEVDGKVLRILADAGDHVQAGAVLAELDPTELRLTRDALAADITSLNAQIDNEQRRAKRFEELKSHDFLAKTQLEDTTAQLHVLRAQRKAAKARLAIAADNLAKTQITAPFEGDVESRRIAVGDLVRRGNPLFTMVDTTHLRAELPVAEDVAAQVAVGLPVLLRVPSEPGVKVDARITDLKPQVDTTSREVTAIVEFDNPGKLRPGATAVGDIELARHENAVMVPAIAVVRRPAGEVVYVVHGDKVEARAVHTGVSKGDKIEITEGLAAGERVAVEGAGFLTDGAQVREGSGGAQ